VSRQREYLADAAAVQFTRNPEGLASALKKIGGLSYGSRVSIDTAEDASHFFFGSIVPDSLMASHPPLVERIKLLDPHFDGRFPRITAPVEPTPPLAATPVKSARTIPMPPIVALQFATAMGNPRPVDLEYAANFKAEIPPALLQATSDPMSAIGLLYSLLLDANEPLRSTQLQNIQNQCPAGILHETLRLAPFAASLSRAQKLPLVSMAVPTLRLLSPDQFATFQKTMVWLIESDQTLDLLEYGLKKLVDMKAAPQYSKSPPRITEFYAVRPLADAACVVLSALAHVGHNDPAQKNTAFQAGWQILDLPRDPRPLLELGQCNISGIDAALDQLNRASVPVKKRILNACIQTDAADGVIQESEAELLRVVACILDCPIPPTIRI
jgi:hypothetical protein